MCIVRIQAADSDSCTLFAWFVFLWFPPYTGAIYSDDNSELSVTEGGSVSFFNNHANNSAGKYYNRTHVRVYDFLPSIVALDPRVRHYFFVLVVLMRQDLICYVFYRCPTS